MNANAGFLSALILMGMFFFVFTGRMSQQDMPLTLATTLCLWAFGRSLDNTESVFRFVMAFQIFLGFGVLMKGPAVVINILCSLAAYVLYSRCWRDIKWFSFIFLENPNHYLIVERESKLEQIDEKRRRVIVAGYPYRNRQSAYLLQGRQIQDNSRLK